MAVRRFGCGCTQNPVIFLWVYVAVDDWLLLLHVLLNEAGSSRGQSKSAGLRKKLHGYVALTLVL